jgi:hypothetical protein
MQEFIKSIGLIGKHDPSFVDVIKGKNSNFMFCLISEGDIFEGEKDWDIFDGEKDLVELLMKKDQIQKN